MGQRDHARGDTTPGERRTHSQATPSFTGHTVVVAVEGRSIPWVASMKRGGPGRSGGGTVLVIGPNRLRGRNVAGVHLWGHWWHRFLGRDSDGCRRGDGRRRCDLYCLGCSRSHRSGRGRCGGHGRSNGGSRCRLRSLAGSTNDTDSTNYHQAEAGPCPPLLPQWRARQGWRQRLAMLRIEASVRTGEAGPLGAIPPLVEIVVGRIGIPIRRSVRVLRAHKRIISGYSVSCMPKDHTQV